MINKLDIRNFKSIKELHLECKRFNVFIGEPNAGKSNILEALGFLSFSFYGWYGNSLKRFVRFEATDNLFYDQLLENPIEILWDNSALKLSFESGSFRGIVRVGENAEGYLNVSDSDADVSNGLSAGAPFKFYRFQPLATFPRRESDFLLPPDGANLVALLRSKRDLLELVSGPLKPLGLDLRLRPLENRIEVDKEHRGVRIAYPYQQMSDTFQRLIFFLLAVVTNRQSVLAFEEPEAYAFPYYTKYLAEAIALDQNENQYFISTHNPYFLLPLIEKAQASEIGVFITYFENYETKVKRLSGDELQQITEMDIFANLESFLEK